MLDKMVDESKLSKNFEPNPSFFPHDYRTVNDPKMIQPSEQVRFAVVIMM